MTVFVMQLQSNLKSIEELISQSRWSYKKPRTVNYRYNQDKLMHRLGDILVQYVNMTQVYYHMNGIITFRHEVRQILFNTIVMDSPSM